MIMMWPWQCFYSKNLYINDNDSFIETDEDIDDPKYLDEDEDDAPIKIAIK